MSPGSERDPLTVAAAAVHRGVLEGVEARRLGSAEHGLGEDQHGVTRLPVDESVARPSLVGELAAVGAGVEGVDLKFH